MSNIPKQWVEVREDSLLFPGNPLRAAPINTAGRAAVELAQDIGEPIFNVKSPKFGAPAPDDGTTSALAAFQRVADAIADVGGGVMDIPAPASSYLIDGTLHLHPNVWMRGPGIGRTTITYQDIAASIIGYTQPRLRSNDALIVSLLPGSKTATLNAGVGANYVAGDYIYLDSVHTGDNGGGGSGPTDACFITKVVSVAGDVLNLLDSVPITLTTANGARCSRLGQLASGIRMTDLALQCTTENPSHNIVANVVDLGFCDSALIERCRVHGAASALIAFQGCLTPTIRSCVLEHAITGAGLGAGSYNTTRPLFIDNIVRDCGFGLDHYMSPLCSTIGNRIHGGGGGRGMKSQGSEAGGIFALNEVSDCGLYGIGAFDTSISIIGNDVHDVGLTDISQVGIGVVGFSTGKINRSIVANNRIARVGGSGILALSILASESTNIQIKDNTIQHVGNLGAGGQIGIYLSCSENEVEGNTIDDYKAIGVYCPGNTTRNRIDHNDFHNGLTGVAIYELGCPGRNFIGPNNRFNGESLNVLPIPPIGGTYFQGERLYNLLPNAADFEGFVCVTSGTPGVWKGFGAIQA